MTHGRCCRVTSSLSTAARTTGGASEMEIDYSPSPTSVKAALIGQNAVNSVTRGRL